MKDSSAAKADNLHRLELRLRSSQRYLILRIMFTVSFLFTGILYRLFELVVGFLCIFFLTLPLGATLVLRKGITGEDVFQRKTIIGRMGKMVTVATFAVNRPILANLSLFYNVVIGEIGLVGASMEEATTHRFSQESGYLLRTKPGIVSLWYIRRSSNIGHEGRRATEWEYQFTRTPTTNLLLMLRTIPACFFGSKSQPTGQSINLFDIEFANMTMVDAVALIEKTVAAGGQSKIIYFINPDCLNKTFSDGNYLETLQKADHIFPDGIGLTIACKMLRSPLRENVNGTDMLPFLCAMAAAHGHSIFLLGGRPGVAERMADNISQKYGVKIAGTHHGFFDHEKDTTVIEAINISGADIVLVAFGAPLQEKWIAANSRELRTKVALGVGGLFDFYSGNTRRAPRWVREIGMEWVYRIIQEPGRMWRRYVIGNPLFLLRVLFWRLRSRKTHNRAHI
jgi:N-acetylglucosaminyldiphosphoundecaprenol N-acetyl-beta-D-mannosaminyltransferase